MSCAGPARRCARFFFLCLILGGCVPAADNPLDEKRDPHFISGKNLLQQRDYQGAIEAFEKATETNPRSAAAHFELGWLYEEQSHDPAAAIYHFQRYLKFSPNPDNADLARKHINDCKSELAQSADVTGAPVPGAQRELERVSLENKDLQTRLAALQLQLDQARAASVTRPSTPAPNPPHETVEMRRAETTHSPATASRSTSPTAMRTHIISRGDTPLGISRRYGISVKALLEANPQARPSHLQIGQTLNIPAP